MNQTICAVEADAQNICGGQIMVCIVKGEGLGGVFQADVAVCREIDTEPYRLAAIRWALDLPLAIR